MLEWDKFEEYIDSLSFFKKQRILCEFEECIENRKKNSTYMCRSFDWDVKINERGGLEQLFSSDELYSEEQLLSEDEFFVLSAAIQRILKQVVSGELSLTSKTDIKRARNLQKNALIYAVAKEFGEEGKLSIYFAGRTLGLGSSSNQYGKNEVLNAQREVEKALERAGTVHDDGYYSDLLDEMRSVSSTISRLKRKALNLGVEFKPTPSWLELNTLSSYIDKYSQMLIERFRDLQPFDERIEKLERASFSAN